MPIFAKAVQVLELADLLEDRVPDDEVLKVVSLLECVLELSRGDKLLITRDDQTGEFHCDVTKCIDLTGSDTEEGELSVVGGQEDNHNDTATTSISQFPGAVSTSEPSPSLFLGAEKPAGYDVDNISIASDDSIWKRASKGKES